MEKKIGKNDKKDAKNWEKGQKGQKKWEKGRKGQKKPLISVLRSSACPTSGRRA